jgi:hypothetical protein
LDDVIPPSGGFLVVNIDSWGYVKTADRAVVHRETRHLNQRHDCVLQFTVAKKHVPNEESAALLELTPEGGGASVWLPKAHRELLEGRLRRFHSCYGGWSVHTLEI